MEKASSKTKTVEPLAWIDIDYTPQVQYLVPFKRALEKRGMEVVVTARDVGLTHGLLRELGVPFEPLGGSFGAHTSRKVSGTLARATKLVTFARRTKIPELILSTGRSGILAARILGRPSFALIDYEHVNLTVYRVARSVLFVPDVIDASAFLDRGIRPGRLLPFQGLKEDISFSAIDLGDFPAHKFPGLGDGVVRVLIRPPSEESHYYASASRELTLAALARLSTLDGVAAIMSPRHAWHVDDMKRFDWQTTPVVLEAPIQFVSLLKAVDVVIAAGGTMAREAAYLGVPTYSTFQGPTGQVDRHLQQIGRMEFLEEKADLEKIRLLRRGALSPLPSKPGLLDDMVDRILERTRGNGAGSPAAGPG